MTKKMLDRAYGEELRRLEAASAARLMEHEERTQKNARPDGSSGIQGRSSRSEGDRKSLLSPEQAGQMAAEYRAAGKRIVFTNGCFDLVHRGHVTYLREASQLGDVLFLGLNSDSSVRRLKGEGRPLLSLEDRVEVLTELRSVDHVIVFDEDTAENLVQLIRPEMYVKGGDYRPEFAPPEARLVMMQGGEYRALSYVEGISTTGLITRIRQL
ncbi:D-glycero-beta-D-manno-heptose 1-phosphate adenylyltransferase [Streptomyces sp. MAI_2237]